MRYRIQTHRLLMISMIVIGTALFVTACTERSAAVEKLHLFSLDIGRMEDQLDLIQYTGRPFRNEFHLVLRNGMISISDAVSRKIMTFNSYGDLLLLYYNAETNPEPVLLLSGGNDETVKSRRAIPFPFRYVGAIASSQSGVLYAEDFVTESQRVTDPQSRALLKSHILKFSVEGKHLASIGQEGIDGTPFPFIHDTFVSERNQLIVVSRTISDWRISAYDENDTLEYELRVVPEELPLVDDATIASLTKIVPAGDQLICKVDYFGGETDDLQFAGSSLLFFAPQSEELMRTIELPSVRQDRRRSQLVSEKGDEVMYELLGAAVGGYAYCIAPLADSTFRMLILSPTGDSVYAGTIELEDKEALLRSFYVSPEGILAALVAEPLAAHVYLWRFDRIVQEATNETR